MPSLEQMTDTQSKRYSGQKGLGTRAFIALHDSDLGVSLGHQMRGVRNFQALLVVTNPIVASHMESVAGFVETKPGLKDAGSIEFDANYVPTAAGWQRIRDGAVSPRQFVSGLFRPEGLNLGLSASSRLPDVHASDYNMYLLLPNSLEGFHVFGYPSGMGPIVAAQESILMSQFSFKVSGRPHDLIPLILSRSTATPSAVVVAGAQTSSGAILTPSGLSGLTIPVVEFGSDATSPSDFWGGMKITYQKATLTSLLTNAGYGASKVAGHYMARCIVANEYEIWSDIVDYDGVSGILTLGTSTSLTASSTTIDAGWPEDEYEAFRETLGDLRGTRKSFEIALYRCDWLDE